MCHFTLCAFIFIVFFERFGTWCLAKDGPICKKAEVTFSRAQFSHCVGEFSSDVPLTAQRHAAAPILDARCSS